MMLLQGKITSWKQSFPESYVNLSITEKTQPNWKKLSEIVVAFTLGEG